MLDQKSKVFVSHRAEIPGDPKSMDDASLSVIREMVRDAFDAADLVKDIRGRSVFVKPNWVRPNPDAPGVTTTDPRVILAVLELCRDAGVAGLGIGDKPGIGLSCRGAEKLLGLTPQFNALGAQFVYLDESPETWRENPQGRICKSIPIPDVLNDYEVILNLPKLKLHMHTGVSLGIKNLFGFVPEHFRMKHHREDLHRFLVDYLHLVRPIFTLIDGIWGLEGQAPICGTAVKDLNTLVASRDMVAADAIGCHLMGVNPQEITMIRMAQKDGFGNGDLNGIEVQGGDLSAIRRSFIRPTLSSQDAYTGIDVLVRGACVGCLSSLRHALDRLHAAGKLKEDPQTILLGMRDQNEKPDLRENPGTLWCYGNCCIDQFSRYFKDFDNARWLQGCPPHFMEFYRAYCREVGLDLPEPEKG